MAVTPGTAERIEERLETLLETEQRLAARVRDVEAELAGVVKAAEERLARARVEGQAEAEQEDRAAAERDHAGHQATLLAIEAEMTRTVEALDGTSSAVIDRLARRALAAAVEGGEG